MLAFTNTVKPMDICVRKCEYRDMRQPLIVTPLDFTVADLLNKKRREQGISLRTLSSASGIKLTRLGDILRMTKPGTTGEISAIATALNTEGWKVTQEASALLEMRPKGFERETFHHPTS